MEPQAPAATPRRKTSKSAKVLKALIAELDAQIVTCEKSSKAADLLLEKCQLSKRLLDAEEADEATQSELQIEQLTRQHSEDSRRNLELTEQNAELVRKVNERLIEYLPDPQHQATASELVALRNALQNVLSFIATLAEETRAELAVRIQESHPAIAETVCRSIKIDYGAVLRFTESPESTLKRLQIARDSNGVIIRAVLAVKHPPPVTPEFNPETFVPDTRSAEEKLRDAKAMTRH